MARSMSDQTDLVTDDGEHATSDVPDEWQGLPDYLLDELA